MEARKALGCPGLSHLEGCWASSDHAARILSLCVSTIEEIESSHYAIWYDCWTAIAKVLKKKGAPALLHFAPEIPTLWDSVNNNGDVDEDLMTRSLNAWKRIGQALEAGALPNLQILSVSHFILHHRMVIPLCNAFRNGSLCNLLILNVSDCWLTDEDVNTLVNAMLTHGCPLLESFDFQNNLKITAQGLKSIGGMIQAGGCPNLKYIYGFEW